MKHLFLAALLAAATIAPAAAQDAAPAEKTVIQEQKVVEGAGSDVEGAGSDEAKLLNACNARKFETSAVLEKGGVKRITKLKLCSNSGADDMAWVKTLKAAKARVADIPDLSPDSRVKIEAELVAEIARLNKAMGH